MNAAVCILRFLSLLQKKWILFTKNKNYHSIEAYTNINWIGDKDDRWSTFGYVTIIEGNLVTCMRKKQNVVASSSVKAEFRDLTNILCKA